VNLRLLQLASPALPVGAYSYSGGLESAIEAGVVRDGADAADWIGAVLEFNLARMEAPVFLRLAAAWERDDLDAVRHWNTEFVASREAAELRAETLQMGHSLRILLRDLGMEGIAALQIDDLAYPTTYAFAAARWRIDTEEALTAYLFAWVENQVLAAVKCIPLGQTEGQRMLLAVGDRIPGAVARARAAEDGALGGFTPGLTQASMRHETQYSRLFRS
jgi:urease accessory protein